MRRALCMAAGCLICFGQPGLADNIKLSRPNTSFASFMYDRNAYLSAAGHRAYDLRSLTSNGPGSVLRKIDSEPGYADPGYLQVSPERQLLVASNRSTHALFKPAEESVDKGELSTNFASSRIEANVNQHAWVIYLGAFDVYGNDPGYPAHGDPAHGTLDQTMLHKVEAFQQVGLVVIAADTPLAQQRFNWGNALQMSAGGIAQKVRVNATGEGQQYLVQGPGRPYLSIPFGQFKIDEIVGMSPQNVRADRYEIVEGVGTWTFSSPWTRYRAIMQTIPADHERQKFKELFYYDPFQRQWKLVVGDFALIDQPFRSNNVNNYLAHASGGN